MLNETIETHRKGSAAGDAQVDKIIDHVLVRFGEEILNIVPGRVSTEVDARLSFDVDRTVRKAHDLIELYRSRRIDSDRILIKVAATWEGVQAADILEKDGIHCNMTLMFSLAQAVACAEVGATLISPFVGRIYDWYKAETGEDYRGADDPGVQSVRGIYNYYKKFGHETEVMGASFRNAGQIVELAGCDLLTISPSLLEELQQSEAKIERKLSPEAALNEPIEKLDMDEKLFRWMMNEDAMATEKLAQGIRIFASDLKQLRRTIEDRLQA